MTKDKNDPISILDRAQMEAECLDRIISTLIELRQQGAVGISYHLIEKYIKTLVGFNKSFASATRSSDSFITFSELEDLVFTLVNEQKELAKELAWEKVKNINENSLIVKKKLEYLDKEINLRKWKKFERSLISTYGKVNIERTALIPATADDAKKMALLSSEKMIFPLDDALGISRLPFKVSVHAMLEIAYWVQEIPSYNRALVMLKRNTEINVNVETMRAVANTIGSIIFNKDVACANKVWDDLNSAKLNFPRFRDRKEHILYIETDGSMIPVRKQSVGHTTEANGKKEEFSSENSDDNERKSVWVENKLAMVFGSDNYKEWENKKGEMQHTIGKREYISYIGSVEEFKKHLFALALRNGYGNYQTVILLSDGATWIRNVKEECFPDSQQILDFFHMSENVSKFSKFIFENDEKTSKSWSVSICQLLRESRHIEVLEIIKGLGKKKLSKSPFNLAQYIENNEENIDYARYKAEGWYIGSGAIESGNKTVIQSRLKQGGMHWSRESAQYISTLMTKSRSKIWNEQVVLPIVKYFGIDDVSRRLHHTPNPFPDDGV
jgi:predicted transcriptional regulator